MKITVFGSTGKIGRLVVDQALEQGHQVTAFARSPEKFDETHANLQIAQGDVLDYPSVKMAVMGCDAVIATLGISPLSKETLRANGSANIIAAMEDAGVKRYICLSGLGAGNSLPLLPFHFRRIIIPLLARRLRADLNLQEKYITSSTLDWTIVRAAMFTKGTRTGTYNHGITHADPPPKNKISHEDVADFIVRQLNDETYIGKMPVISY